MSPGSHCWGWNILSFLWSLCKSFEDRAPVDEILKWVAVTWPNDWLSSHSNGYHGDMPGPHLMQTSFCSSIFNTLRPRENCCHLADNIFKLIFLNENEWISLKIVPNVRINNILALVQIMAWRRLGVKPLSEPMMVNLLMYICVTQPQWVDKLMLQIFALDQQEKLVYNMTAVFLWQVKAICEVIARNGIVENQNFHPITIMIEKKK